MSTSQIRFTKTPEIQNILNFLKTKFYGLSETEIVKLILSKTYKEELELDENGFTKEQQKELKSALNDESEGPFESMEEFIASMKN